MLVPRKRQVIARIFELPPPRLSIPRRGPSWPFRGPGVRRVVSQSQAGPREASGQGALPGQEEFSPGNSEQCRQTTEPPGFLPSPHKPPCQRQRVCETLPGGQWELKGPQGSLAVVTLFLRSPGEGGFLKTAIHTAMGSSCCGGQAPDGDLSPVSGPRLSHPRAPPYRPISPGPPQMQGTPGLRWDLWLNNFGVGDMWVRSPVHSFTGCVTWGKLVNLSVPQFLHV